LDEVEDDIGASFPQSALQGRQVQRAGKALHLMAQRVEPGDDGVGLDEDIAFVLGGVVRNGVVEDRDAHRVSPKIGPALACASGLGAVYPAARARTAGWQRVDAERTMRSISSTYGMPRAVQSIGRSECDGCSPARGLTSRK